MMSNRQEKSLQNSQTSERKRKAKNLGAELFYSEEAAILDSNVNRDVQSHFIILNTLTSIMTQVNDFKSSPASQQDPEEMARLRMEGVLGFAALKKINRINHLRSKKVREQTQEAKQCIDEQHLQLQNLLYELQHLQREIQKCLEFKSKHEEISLVTEQEFIQTQQNNIEDPHKLMLARMDWELKERIKLCEKLEECRKKKTELVLKIATKKAHLGSLQPKLNSILHASKPLQEDLNMRVSEEREQLLIVPHLPPSLHLLFIQASSLSRYVKGVEVEVVGDGEMVEIGEEEFVLEESDSDDNEDNNDTEVHHNKKSKHHRDNNNKLLKKRLELFKTHPLSLVINCSLPHLAVFHLTFHHFIHLHFVSVSFKLTPSISSISSTHPLFTPLSFLSNLFEAGHVADGGSGDDGGSVDGNIGGGGLDCDAAGVEDDGQTSPNPLNSYILNKLTIDDLTLHLPDQTGRPFRWAQVLCGMEVMLGGCVVAGKGGVKGMVNDVKRGGVEGVVKRVSNRIKERLLLFNTIQQLESDISSESSEGGVKLTSWNSISLQEFSKTSRGRPANHHFLFSASLTHPSHPHPLTFTLSIPFSYPNHTPVFTLNLQSDQGTLTAHNNQAVRELECMLNTSPPPSSLTSLLTTLSRSFHALLQSTTPTKGPIRSIIIV